MFLLAHFSITYGSSGVQLNPDRCAYCATLNEDSHKNIIRTCQIMGQLFEIVQMCIMDLFFLIYNGTFKPAGQSKVSSRDCVSASAVSLLKPH